MLKTGNRTIHLNRSEVEKSIVKHFHNEDMPLGNVVSFDWKKDPALNDLLVISGQDDDTVTDIYGGTDD